MVFQQDVTITVNLTGTPLSGDPPTVTMALTPYGVSAVPQVPVDCGAEPCLDAEDWKYVVDLKGRQDRASVTFPSSPILSVTCAATFMRLDWVVPPELEYEISGFVILRSDNGGAYQQIATPDATQRSYVDVNVSSGVTYCYQVVAQTYYTLCDLPSNEECLSTCPPPPLGPMDVAFILDNTGSMSDLPLTKLRNGIDALLDTIQAASGNDYRLALVTPDDDQVHVRLNFSENNREYFTNALNDPDLTNHGNYGNGEPESTDECLNTVVNALAESGRINPRTCNSQPSDPLQIEDFDPGFDREAMKLVVVITDHGPDGFCDDSYDGTMAAAYASQARTKCMKINAVQVDYHSDATEVMENYYQTSCGWYSQIPGDGTGIVEAVTWMLYAPGFPGNCNCP